jgi:hypothetical protein
MEKRPIRIEGEIGYVLLADGTEATIDAEDAELVGQYNWRLSNGYVVTELPKVNGKRRLLRLHRLVMGDPEGKLVDHREGAKIDNRKDLLRPATNAENNKNAKMRDDNTSGHKGVYWHKAKKKWHAQISHEGKRLYLGRFAALEEAHAAYCEAANRMHGEFARTA